MAPWVARSTPVTPPDDADPVSPTTPVRGSQRGRRETRDKDQSLSATAKQALERAGLTRLMKGPPPSSDIQEIDSSSTDTEEHVQRVTNTGTRGGIPLLDPKVADKRSSDPPLLVAGDDVLKRAAYVRIRQWFDAHPQVATDADFAFFFKDEKEATRRAGRAVAAEWVRVADSLGRTPNPRSTEFSTEAQCAATQNYPPTLRDRSASATRGQKRKQLEDEHEGSQQSPGKKARQGASMREALQDDYVPARSEGESVGKHGPYLDTLKSAIKICGSIEASGSSEEEFDAAAGKEAEKAAESASFDVLKNVGNIWLGITKYARQKDIKIPAMTGADLRSYIYTSSEPICAFNALQWMVKNLEFKLPIDRVADPSKSAKDKVDKYPKPTIVLVPPMLIHLEEEMVKAIEANNPTWPRLLSQWLAVVGVMRSKHLRRSYPVKLTGSVLHCWCRGSQQEESKNGFAWSCRAHLVSNPTYNWAVRFLETWKQVPEEKKDEMGMCFDIEKMLPLSLKTAVDQTRSGMASGVKNWNLLTYESFRQTPLLIADKANFSSAEKAALGDWITKPCAGKKDVPHRYAGDRKQMSTEMKLEVSLLLEKFLYVNDWSEILDKKMQETRNDPVMASELASLVNKDKTLIWKDPLRGKVTPKFKLWDGLQACKKAIQQEAKFQKWAKSTSYKPGKTFEFEKIKAQQFDGTLSQLLDMGAAGRLKLNTLHFSGMVSPAVHSSSISGLNSILRVGFDVEKDTDPERHATAKGWLRDKKGIFFGNLNKSYGYSDNEDGRSISGEAIDLGNGNGRISYQGLFCADWPTDHSLHGHWKRFKDEMDDEVFSAVDVPVVGAYVLQTNFRLNSLPSFKDPEWQRLAVSKCGLLPESELKQEHPPKDIEEEEDEVVAQAMPCIPGKVLSPVNREGTRLCAAFQIGECTQNKCIFEHRCATVIQGGRVCYGTHPAYKCYAKKAINPALMPAMQGNVTPAVVLQPSGGKTRHSETGQKPNESNKADEVPSGSRRKRNSNRDRSVSAVHSRKVTLKESPQNRLASAVPSKKVTLKEVPPARKRKRHDISETLEQSNVPKREGKVRIERETTVSAHTTAQSHWAALFDGLAKKRQNRKGHSNRPEPPTLIAKLCKEGGELWLSGLPTEETFPYSFENKQFDLQVCCFAGSPTGKTSNRSKGILLPSALQVTINMDAKYMHRTVEGQVRDCISLIVFSLIVGENVLVHCMAGCHRGGIVAAVIRAIVMNQTFDAARMAINQVRFVEIRKALSRYGPEEVEAAWFKELVKQGQERVKHLVETVSKQTEAYQIVAWGVSGSAESTEIHALVHDVKTERKSSVACLVPICMTNQKHKEDWTQKAFTTKDDQTAIGCGQGLCKGCAALLTARWRVKAGYGPGAQKSMLIEDPQTKAIYRQYAKS